LSTRPAPASMPDGHPPPSLWRLRPVVCSSRPSSCASGGARQPLMPLSIFRSRTLAAGDGVTLLAGAWNAAKYCSSASSVSRCSGTRRSRRARRRTARLRGLLRGIVGAAVVARLGIRPASRGERGPGRRRPGHPAAVPATSRYPLLGVVLLVVGFGTTSTVFAATIAGPRAWTR